MKRLALIMGIFFVFFLMTGVGIVAATTFTVDSNGNGDYTTIQSAVNIAEDGDTILVHGGPYKENIRVNKQLTIKSNSDDLVVVKAANTENHVFSVSADNVVLSGFNISGAYEGYKAGIFLDSVNYSLLSNNHVWHNYYGIHLKSSQYNSLENNVVWDNHYGFSFNQSSNNIVTENSAHHTTCGFILNYNSNYNSFISITASENKYGFYTESEKNELKDNSSYQNRIDYIYQPPKTNETTEKKPSILDYIKFNEIFGIAIGTAIVGCMGLIINNSSKKN